MKVLKTIKATVTGDSARLMMVLVLTMFFISLLSLNSYADNAEDLIDAATKGNISSVKALLDNGADVNAKTGDGETALMFASMYGHSGPVSWLLNKGADVSAKTKSGFTALFIASLKGHIHIVQLLKEAGAGTKK